MAATHNGTCQVCGREQALPNSLMAKHGYTVEHHFFEGVCPGANELPLEESRKLADDCAASLMRQYKELTTTAEQIQLGKIKPKFADAGCFYCKDRRGHLQHVEVLFADATAYDQRRAVESFLYATQSRAKMARDLSTQITDRANAVTGKKALTVRGAKEARKQIVAGTKFKLGGTTYTALRIVEKQAQGCGPYMNGHVMPHVVYLTTSGKEWAYPVRLIRQAAILS